MKNNLKVEIVKWVDGHTQLKNIREKVFIQEQKVTPQLEWDGMDEKAIHFLVFKDEEAIGCARAIVIQSLLTSDEYFPQRPIFICHIPCIHSHIT